MKVVHLATRGNQTDKPYLEFISNLDSFPSISLSDIVSIRGNQTDKPYLEFISNLDSFPSISLSDIVNINLEILILENIGHRDVT